jgi:hypothetical protein
VLTLKNACGYYNFFNVLKCFFIERIVIPMPETINFVDGRATVGEMTVFAPD